MRLVVERQLVKALMSFNVRVECHTDINTLMRLALLFRTDRTTAF